MISLLVQPDLFAKSLSASPQSPPTPTPTPVDFFHRRYDDEFWRTHDPLVKDGALLAVPRPTPGTLTGARRPILRRRDVFNTFLQAQKAPLSAQELCTGSLNVQTYNRAALGDGVEHLGHADLATPLDTLNAALLQLRSIRQDEAKLPTYTRHDYEEGTHVHGMVSTGDALFRAERNRIETHCREVDRIGAVVHRQLKRADHDEDNTAAMRKALKGVRRELIREALRTQDAIALLETRAAEIERAFDPFRARDGSGRAVPPAQFPVQASNVVRGARCYVTLADENEFCTWSRFCARSIETIRTLLLRRYASRSDCLQELCSDIELWLALAGLAKAL